MRILFTMKKKLKELYWQIDELSLIFWLSMIVSTASLIISILALLLRLQILGIL